MKPWHSKQIKHSLISIVSFITILSFVFSNIAFALPTTYSKLRNLQALQNPKVAEDITSALLSNEGVGSYIAQNIPENLRSATSFGKLDKLKAGSYKKVDLGGLASAYLIPIKGLFKNTGQFAHIGLEQTYDGQTVIYIDSDYQGNETVINHELTEINYWKIFKIQQAQKPHTQAPVRPGEYLRSWMKRNPELAREKAEEIHALANQKYNITPLYKDKQGEIDHTSIANLLAMFPKEEGTPNLAAGEAITTVAGAISRINELIRAPYSQSAAEEIKTSAQLILRNASDLSEQDIQDSAELIMALEKDTTSAYAQYDKNTVNIVKNSCFLGLIHTARNNDKIAAISTSAVDALTNLVKFYLSPKSTHRSADDVKLPEKLDDAFAEIIKGNSASKVVIDRVLSAMNGIADYLYSQQYPEGKDFYYDRRQMTVEKYIDIAKDIIIANGNSNPALAKKGLDILESMLVTLRKNSYLPAIQDIIDRANTFLYATANNREIADEVSAWASGTKQRIASVQPARGADNGIIRKDEHQDLRLWLEKVKARSEENRRRDLEELFGVKGKVEIYQVPSMFDEYGKRKIRGHYAIRDGIVYVDKFTLIDRESLKDTPSGLTILKHEIDEITGILKFCQEKFGSDDRPAREKLVDWLDNTGPEKEVTDLLLKIHNDSAKLTEGAIEIVPDVRPSQWFGILVNQPGTSFTIPAPGARPVRGAAGVDEEALSPEEAAFRAQMQPLIDKLLDQPGIILHRPEIKWHFNGEGKHRGGEGAVEIILTDLMRTNDNQRTIYIYNIKNDGEDGHSFAITDTVGSEYDFDTVDELPGLVVKLLRGDAAFTRWLNAGTAVTKTPPSDMANAMRRAEGDNDFGPEISGDVMRHIPSAEEVNKQIAAQKLQETREVLTAAERAVAAMKGGHEIPHTTPPTGIGPARDDGSSAGAAETPQEKLAALQRELADLNTQERDLTLSAPFDAHDEVMSRAPAYIRAQELEKIAQRRGEINAQIEQLKTEIAAQPAAGGPTVPISGLLAELAPEAPYANNVANALTGLEQRTEDNAIVIKMTDGANGSANKDKMERVAKAIAQNGWKIKGIEFVDISEQTGIRTQDNEMWIVAEDEIDAFVEKLYNPNSTRVIATKPLTGDNPELIAHKLILAALAVKNINPEEARIGNQKANAVINLVNEINPAATFNINTLADLVSELKSKAKLKRILTEIVGSLPTPVAGAGQTIDQAFEDILTAVGNI